jgi:UDP-N-acetylglucosamine 4,6-dehydratase
LESQLTETVLITGGTGFLGRFLARRLRDAGKRVVLGARNYEQSRHAREFSGCETKPLDVSSIESVRDAVLQIKPDLIIHAAATKSVGLSEREPMECVDVNVLGSQNVARVAIEAGVDRVLAVSTDKAAPPVNTTYGLSKALMERMYCTLDNETGTRFASVRFGNIAWSTGSVFPLWSEMQKRDGIVRATGPHMRRLFFSVHDAVDLVETALDNFELVAGRVLTCDMGVAQMSEILEVWTREYGGAWEKAEERHGDSVDQFLIGEGETEYTREISIDDKKFYLIDFRDKKFGNVSHVISSENSRRLSDGEITRLIRYPDQDLQEQSSGG